ncbi:MAG: isoprenylcysteine carboxylmethyltransferase family protein [Salinimicrobium sp.]
MAVPNKDKFFVALQVGVFLAWIMDVDLWYIRLPENLEKLALVFAGLGLLLVIIALFQLNTKLSPFPSPKKGAKLINSGVYAFARHPIYSGILFMGFGLSVWFHSGYKLLISFVLLLVFYFKSRYEEQRLQQQFPEYVFYKRQTGRFFPKFKWRI